LPGITRKKEKNENKKIPALHPKSHTPEGGNFSATVGDLSVSHPRIHLKQTTPFTVLCLCS